MQEFSLQRQKLESLPSNVILVAGPSAAGKTTFIQQLISGRLPKRLQDMFPPDLHDWGRIEGNVLIKRGATLESVLSQTSNISELILHYDTLLISRYGIGSYHDDPVFSVLAEVEKLVVVTICPPLPDLKRQFDARRRRKFHERGWVKNSWRKLVRRALRPIRLRLRGKSASKTADIYRNMNRVGHSYREWDDFTASLVRTTPGARLIKVEPRMGHAGETFAVVS